MHATGFMEAVLITWRREHRLMSLSAVELGFCIYSFIFLLSNWTSPLVIHDSHLPFTQNVIVRWHAHHVIFLSEG